MSEEPLIYLILGAAGSGRREVLADLLEGGLDENERAVVLLAEGESDAPEARRLADRAEVHSWRWVAAGESGAIDADRPDGAHRIFLVTDGRANPVDQLEAFRAWLTQNGLAVARIICVVDCRLAEANPPLLAWYDACVHFSDVVLLNHREGVSNKWMSDFQGRFHQERFPCLFEIVKGGKVRNPALILEPQARRMSHVFDEEPDWTVVDAEGDELDESEDADGGDAEVGLQVEEDRYFERRSGGRRVKELPDVSRYLAARSPT